MQLEAEVKDNIYADLPRVQDPVYVHPATNYLKAEAKTGRRYVDLNAAAKNYSGPWMFGSENVQVLVGNLRAQWVQWCPVPAGIADGILLKGNVIYQNPDGSHKMSGDMYEGIIVSEPGGRFFEGKTQHTFYGRNFAGGSLKVVANIRIPLVQHLAYNPLMVHPKAQAARTQKMASRKAQFPSQQPLSYGGYARYQSNSDYGY